MIENNQAIALWKRCLNFIKDNVNATAYKTWFEPVVPLKYEDKALTIGVPSPFFYEYLEEKYVGLLRAAIYKEIGEGTELMYSILTDKTNHIAIDMKGTERSSALPPQAPIHNGNKAPSLLQAPAVQDLDPHLNPNYNFENFIKGTSNEFSRTVAETVAQNPARTFNPLFLYGPSGVGKTHLINAIGVRTKEIYPQKRVLYISARLFQVQYTNAVLNNRTNDFINFYQTIDMLIVDDIQEWVSAAKTQETFFHIFNHLFRNGKRIILACDRPPVDLQGMSDRLLTRFSCGLIAELEKPNIQLCVDILNSKIKRDGLTIPEDVVYFIAQTANYSVRGLEGVINSLLAFSVVYNCKIDMRLAERVIKRAVKIDNEPLTIDDILDTVCNHFNVTTAAVASRSRKRDYVTARQVSMYLAQKYTKMPASRIGKLIGGRDHSTVIHSCTQIEQRIKTDKLFSDEIASIENSFKLKK